MSPARLLALASFGIAGLAAAGCGSGDGLPREPISGTVTLDGKPLESGTITFRPDGPNPPPTAVEAPIAAGAFALTAARGPAPGPYRVAVSALVPMPVPPPKPGAVDGTGAPDVPAEPPLRESIPARYNAQTTLKADVAKGGRNAFDFPLTSP